MALTGSELLIKDTDGSQYQTIRSWGLMRWDKSRKVLTGLASLDLLDRLSKMVRLPPAVERRRAELRAVQDAVDRERMNPAPVPLADYPVKMNLYDHQKRGANMALLTFGWVAP